MAWQKRGGGGPILKWKDFPVDGTVEGRFLGLRTGKEFQGKVSKLGSIDKLDGTGQVTFPANTVIENNLTGVAIGTLVRIVHLGMTRGSGGVEYRNFDIFIDDGSGGTTAPVLTGVAAMEQSLAGSKGKQVSGLMIDALKAKYPDPAVYQKALGDVLKANGISVTADEEVPF